MRSTFSAVAGLAAVVTGCTSSNTIRTSADTAIVQVSAAPVCGGTGAGAVAQKMAALETIKAGYDRYIIFDGSAANNVRTSQMPGTVQTSGTISGNSIYTTSTYTPGPVIMAGSHDQALAVKMFREGEPGAENALSARDALGPKWPEMVKTGKINTCF